MNMFYNQMFNPQYVNPQYYFQVLQHQKYEQEQNDEINKAVKAIHDLCEASKKIDPSHQQQAFCACLTEMAITLGWKDEEKRY